MPPTGISRLQSWLNHGYQGEMQYLERRCEAYADPNHVLDGVRSLVMLGMHYAHRSRAHTLTGQGRIARYALGTTDYHDTLRQRLRPITDRIHELAVGCRTRSVIDTAPLLEREFAHLAGLGWFGKNTMLIHPRQGSYFFLAAILTDQVLAYDTPFQTDHCGSCTACLDACPTQAFPAPGVLDATRCISYLTIEHRSAVAGERRRDIGDWLFGCDVCQEVCPWNRFAPGTDVVELEPVPEWDPIDLRELFWLDDEGFRKRFRKTPLWRAKRRGLLRNAAIVLGNQGDPGNFSALGQGLNDPEPLVRAAVAWALGHIQHPETAATLQRRLDQETDGDVRTEIRLALQPTASSLGCNLDEATKANPERH